MGSPDRPEPGRPARFGGPSQRLRDLPIRARPSAPSAGTTPLRAGPHATVSTHSLTDMPLRNVAGRQLHAAQRQRDKPFTARVPAAGLVAGRFRSPTPVTRTRNGNPGQTQVYGLRYVHSVPEGQPVLLFVSVSLDRSPGYIDHRKGGRPAQGSPPEGVMRMGHSNTCPRRRALVARKTPLRWLRAPRPGTRRCR